MSQTFQTVKDFFEDSLFWAVKGHNHHLDHQYYLLLRRIYFREQEGDPFDEADAQEAAQILRDAGKTEGDLAADLKLLRQRFVWQAQVDEEDAVKKKIKAAEAKITAADQKFAKTKADYIAKNAEYEAERLKHESKLLEIHKAKRGLASKHLDHRMIEALGRHENHRKDAAGKLKTRQGWIAGKEKAIKQYQKRLGKRINQAERQELEGRIRILQDDIERVKKGLEPLNRELGRVEYELEYCRSEGENAHVSWA